MAKRTGIGLLIILIGIGFLLQQADLFQFTNFLVDWWPLIFIIIGFVQLLYHAQVSLFTGPLFIIIGAILLMNQWTDMSLFNFLWPIIIIYVGIIFIFFQSKDHKSIDENHMLQSFSLFSGSEIISRSNPLKGGTVTTIFGGADIDIREAVIEDDEIVIELTALFGGIELRVPHDVQVHVKGVPIFGGWEDSTRITQREEATNPKKINVKCITIFGGAEITN